MTAQLHRLERATSTMDLLHQVAAEGAEPGTAVVAGEQSGGRGSRGRHWESPLGGLWLSVLYRPASAARVELMSLRVGLTVAAALAEIGEPAVRLKWPNDLLLDDRKLGGILCEARWQGDALAWMVVGVGLNVLNPVPDGAVRLAERHPGVTPEELLPGLLDRLRALDGGNAPLTAEELGRFAARDWLCGRRLTAPVAGVAEGIGEDGALLVRGSGGATTALRAGTVELADTAGRS
ncbi:MAG: biotin--[acetyl-CoA-carboxylase] ligase [Gemmatimonadales bacterium]|nr:biotin--[acetyl-CoA-carboxylase] ligase [Gemmatimonadales bacterium]MDQ3426278.1 biotin--[acetyl-CoA-carboxylase] ligase [Gemmatimonadota bacterium]